MFLPLFLLFRLLSFFSFFVFFFFFLFFYFSSSLPLLLIHPPSSVSSPPLSYRNHHYIHHLLLLLLFLVVVVLLLYPLLCLLFTRRESRPDEPLIISMYPHVACREQMTVHTCPGHRLTLHAAAAVTRVACQWRKRRRQHDHGTEGAHLSITGCAAQPALCPTLCISPSQGVLHNQHFVLHCASLHHRVCCTTSTLSYTVHLSITGCAAQPALCPTLCISPSQGVLYNTSP